MSDRTVLDVADNSDDFEWYSERWFRTALTALGVDPDMPFDKFKHALEVGLVVVETPERAARMTDDQLAAINGEVEKYDRWLRWGQRVDETEPLTYRPEDRQNVPAAVAAYRRGWNACLDHIKGDL